ncbi:Y1-Tnp domain-containing protein [Sulfidibacter corallicola]|uniref:Transposase IS200-like domain-containing protein n=1 Tax=Sulfidibacter corallicola TaxID=2818388 RepID=A0A8A4TRX7_SULCO|nr:hypothetical protein [Sulfidibacter corallicola]QTD52729.1 hypothetical protein J3U87_09655 [Sulfidibacter corallicola]
MSNLTEKLFYRCHLPHWHPERATYFITFRLVGSLPHSVLEAWRKDSVRNHPTKRLQLEHRRKWFRKFESVMHAGGSGPMWLANPEVADMVAESLHYRDEKVFTLDCFCIMPNHVHMVITPLKKGSPTGHATSTLQQTTIPGIMHSLKSYTGLQANKILDRSGPFWEMESFDHWLRTPEHWRHAVRYILENPVHAKLVAKPEDYPWNYCRDGYAWLFGDRNEKGG